jgi:hypothetical protein
MKSKIKAILLAMSALAATASYGIEKKAETVVVLWDISGSSSSKNDSRVGQEILPTIVEAVKSLQPIKGSQVVLHGFGDDRMATDVVHWAVQTKRTNTQSGKLLGDTADNLSKQVTPVLQRYVAQANPHGASSIVASFEDAAEYCNVSCKIFVISDGLENGSRVSYPALLDSKPLPKIRADLTKADITWYGFGDQLDDDLRLKLKDRWLDLFDAAKVKSVSIRRW